MSENTTEEDRDDAQRLGDRLRDGEVEAAVDQLTDDDQLVVIVERDDSTWLFTGDESNIDEALSSVSDKFDMLNVEIEKYESNTYFGTGGIPA